MKEARGAGPHRNPIRQLSTTPRGGAERASLVSNRNRYEMPPENQADLYRKQGSTPLEQFDKPLKSQPIEEL